MEMLNGPLDGASLAGPITSLSVVPSLTHGHLPNAAAMMENSGVDVPISISGTQPGLQTKEVSGGSRHPKLPGPPPQKMLGVPCLPTTVQGGKGLAREPMLQENNSER